MTNEQIQHEIEMDNRESFEDFYQDGNDESCDFSRWDDGEYCDDKVALCYVIWEQQQNKINCLEAEITQARVDIEILCVYRERHEKEWVCVSDRNPAFSGRFMCFCHEPNSVGVRRESIRICWFEPKNIHTGTSDVWHSGDGLVTHWMMLPLLPVVA